jgi:hypothetical protein
MMAADSRKAERNMAVCGPIRNEPRMKTRGTKPGPPPHRPLHIVFLLLRGLLHISVETIQRGR